MNTVTVQIGNTDNKLTQAEWSDYVSDLRLVTSKRCGVVHFRGSSPSAAPWQNHCVVADCENIEVLNVELSALCEKYNQVSVAVTVGITKFIK